MRSIGLVLAKQNQIFINYHVLSSIFCMLQQRDNFAKKICIMHHKCIKASCTLLRAKQQPEHGATIQPGDNWELRDDCTSYLFFITIFCYLAYVNTQNYWITIDKQMQGNSIGTYVNMTPLNAWWHWKKLKSKSCFRGPFLIVTSEIFWSWMTWG